MLRPGQLVVLESTTYPGTTEDLVQPILETSGLVAGFDFALAYSPERIDPGTGRSLRETPEDRRRRRPGRHRGGRRLLRAARRPGRHPVLAPQRRDGQADREHLPPGQHRPRQRAGHHRPGDRRRHLGGARRRRHQAVRLPAVLARPRRGRPLHRHRPQLPVVEGRAAARLRHRLRPARPVGQQPHAGLRRIADQRGAQRGRQAAARRPTSSCSAWPTRPASPTSGSRPP